MKDMVGGQKGRREGKSGTVVGGGMGGEGEKMGRRTGKRRKILRDVGGDVDIHIGHSPNYTL